MDRTAKKKRLTAIMTALAIGFILLWFSDILPLKIAEITASIYMSKQDGEDAYVVSGSDYSPAHDCYFIYFMDPGSSQQRNVGINYRYFPFFVCFDSDDPGHVKILEFYMVLNRLSDGIKNGAWIPRRICVQ